ncbi:IclR family transcriptional regulator [Paraburkholderia terricola]|uniref:IclR family transcriptional regulator n=1 Tax=Paraburkholderia terricola TaxID=169427 RepID=UPI000A05AD3D|nr:MULTISPECIES: helix-turn-helix domain-containing protein [Paraburkholderia]
MKNGSTAHYGHVATLPTTSVNRAIESQGTRLDKVARVLELVSTARSGLTLGEITVQASLSPPSAHRLVNALIAARLLDGGGGRSRYRLGGRLSEIFKEAPVSASALQAAIPLLQQLADSSGEVAYLVTLSNRGAELVGTMQPQTSGRNLVMPEELFHPCSTAAGKALFAYQSKDKTVAAIKALGENNSAEWLGHLDELWDELAEVKRVAYAINDARFDPDVLAICCPVLGVWRDSPSFAIGVVGLKQRMLEGAPLSRLASEIRSAVERWPGIATLLAAPG